jgi:foldase protein PrsA
MKKLISLLLIVVLMLSVVGCQAKEKEPAVEEVPENVVAVVNGEEINIDDYLKNFKILEYTYTVAYGEEIWAEEYNGLPLKDVIMEELLNNLITERIISQIVSEKGIEIAETDIDIYYLDFQDAIDSDADLANFYAENDINEAFIREQIKRQLIVDEYYKIVEDGVKADETQLADMYDNFKLEVKASHILVPTEEVAMSVLSRLETEDFATVASEVSEDPGSKDSGGDLGFFARNVMIPEFEAAAFKMEIGEMSEPIQTDYGYHIIKVEDYHTLNGLMETGITEDEIEMFKNYIVSFLANDEFDTQVAQLYENADIQKYTENIQ